MHGADISRRFSMEAKSRSPLASVLSEFSESTTLHGVSYLSKGNAVRRLFWGLAILSCWGICIWQVYGSIKSFTSWPISTSLTPERASELTFPAVTICNFNVFNLRQYERSLKVKNMTAKARKDLIEFISKLSSITSGHGTDMESLTELNLPTEFLKKRGVLSDKYMALVSQPIEDILSFKWPVPCTFSRKKCGLQNFTTIITARFGQCYTFNSGRESAPLKLKMVGTNNGLKLTLFLDQSSYVKNYMTPQAGFKVLIHHQKEYPFVEELGFAVQPGTHTFCAIRRKKIDSLPDPFRTNCGERDLQYMAYFNISYSRPACIAECVFKSIIRRCKCQPFHQIFSFEVAELCSLEELATCALPSYGDLDDLTGDCFDNCPEPCHRVKYDTTLSYATVLSNAFYSTQPMFQESDKNQMKGGPSSNMSEEEIAAFYRDNVVGLDVYYEELSQDNIKQQPAFDLLSLVGNIGGYLGLFLGMSFLTVFEFLDLFATVIHSLKAHSVDNHRPTSTETGASDQDL